MNEKSLVPIEAEALDLARLASSAYARAVEWYRREYGHTPEQADAAAREPLRYVVGAPAHEVSWLALNTLMSTEPATATAIWERVKHEAAGHVENGYHVAEALGYSTPWERAQFAAVRAGFYDEWQPRGGVERALLDTMAMAFCGQLHWAGQLQQRAATDPKPLREEWNLPLQATADAIDQAAGMMDRYNRLMIRTLRALRDLRRYTVVINGAQQVNIGNQQAIVSER